MRDWLAVAPKPLTKGQRESYCMPFADSWFVKLYIPWFGKAKALVKEMR